MVILCIVLCDVYGGELEIFDFVLCWCQNDCFYCLVSLICQVCLLVGSLCIIVCVCLLVDWGVCVLEFIWGSNYVCWVLFEYVLWLIIDVLVCFVCDGLLFVFNYFIYLILGVDELFNCLISGYVQEVFQCICDYWCEWVCYLFIFLEWQDVVICSVIMLKLCQYEDSGVIIVVMIIFIFEVFGSVCNWDYCYCWLCDVVFVVCVLNCFGVMCMMEQFFGYIFNLVMIDGILQLLYGIGFEVKLDEDEVFSLFGYRGMGLVWCGNLVWVQCQYDVYGSVVLVFMQLFFDWCLQDLGDVYIFVCFEFFGEQVFVLYDVFDVGLWEFRGCIEVYIYISVMCWVVCDCLCKIVVWLKCDDCVYYWCICVDIIYVCIMVEFWSEVLGYFIDIFGGYCLDVLLLLLVDIGFIDVMDVCFIVIVEVIGCDFKYGNLLYCYVVLDDFGELEISFIICMFWYIDVLVVIGCLDEVCEMFELLLKQCNYLGLLLEDLVFDIGEVWGNFLQIYLYVGLIIVVMCLLWFWQEVL